MLEFNFASVGSKLYVIATLAGKKKKKKDEKRYDGIFMGGFKLSRKKLVSSVSSLHNSLSHNETSPWQTPVWATP